MIVVFKNPPIGEENPKLTTEKRYVVIGIDDAFFRVIDDDSEPILYPKGYFETVDSSIPTDWIRMDHPDGEYHIDPPECSAIGFYEDYFDDKEYAQEAFRRATKRILSQLEILGDASKK
ncbi:hypothetical protein [Desulfatibacillum aliphaticivorans]|uniref:hypothetical protein n=1 Tax=Desulfatibacillum aliphaticivorans TaxID=218208 RepID=UPI0006852697|nr:hypothetical protein [Desulfatibacillum aliphaticivorans]